MHHWRKIRRTTRERKIYQNNNSFRSLKHYKASASKEPRNNTTTTTRTTEKKNKTIKQASKQTDNISYIKLRQITTKSTTTTTISETQIREEISIRHHHGNPPSIFFQPHLPFFYLPLSVLLTLSSSFFANVVDRLCVLSSCPTFLTKIKSDFPNKNHYNTNNDNKTNKEQPQKTPPQTPNNGGPGINRQIIALTNTDQEITPENGLQDQNSK